MNKKRTILRSKSSSNSNDTKIDEDIAKRIKIENYSSNKKEPLAKTVKIVMMDQAPINKFPACVLRFILIRVGYKELFKIRTLCKRWLKITENAYFMLEMLKQKCQERMDRYGLSDEQYELIPFFLQSKWDDGKWAPIFRVKKVMQIKKEKDKDFKNINYKCQWATIMHVNQLYEGRVDQLEFSGDGNLYDAIYKTIYKGKFKNNRKEGLGQIKIVADGSVYNDVFNCDYALNIGKKFALAPMHIFRESVYTFKDDTIYSGEFKNGLRHGNGELVCSGGHRYIGDFKNGLRHGNGELEFTNGDSYIGEFENDLFNGKGTLYYNDEASYHGYFKDGLFHGEGFLEDNDCTLSGKFENGRFCGHEK